MACRRLINFLGIRVGTTSGKLEVLAPRHSDDADIELLGLTKVGIEEFIAAPPGPPERTREACECILRAADKGVAHLTVGRDERAFADDLLVCAQVTQWAIKTFAYDRHGTPVPHYGIWTEA